MILSKLRGKYKLIEYSIKIFHKCPVTGDWIILLSDMPHLVKCIVASLELSSRKDSKKDLKYGKCFLNLYIVECVWRTLGGGTSQLQESKLTMHTLTRMHSPG